MGIAVFVVSAESISVTTSFSPDDCPVGFATSIGFRGADAPGGPAFGAERVAAMAS
jgi:hypothetical protein